MIIYKYTISRHEVTELKLPYGSKILHVNVQDGIWTAWALVDNDNESALTVSVEVYGTGHPIHKNDLTYVNTFFEGPFVWHAFTRGIS